MALDLNSATIIQTEINIQKPISEVFRFASNPSMWCHWHPATESVLAPHSSTLLKGEKTTETIRSDFGPSFQAEWIVREYAPNGLWVIETDCHEFLGRISYQLTETTTAETQFKRVLEFQAKNRPWVWLNSTFVRWVLVVQSKKALRNLKAVLESSSTT